MSIKQRLLPTPGQVSVLRGYQGQARFVWNQMLHLRKTKVIMPREMSTMLAVLREQHDWLKAGPSAVQQQAFRELQEAYARHFANPTHFGAPSFKKRGHSTGVYLRDLKLRRVNRKYGETFVPILVNPKHTSQRCAECGHIAKENRESQAVFRCVSCDHTDNADRNAARNILAKGLLSPEEYAAGHAVKGRTLKQVNVNSTEPPEQSSER